jgi:integrase/recombinase XerD
MTRPPLRAALEDYLSLRRALGFKLNNTGRLLGQFVGYLEERGIHTITTDDALTWASLPAGASPHWRRIRLSAVRGFAAYQPPAVPSRRGGAYCPAPPAAGPRTGAAAG